MKDILLLRFDALLLSFGGVMVDQIGPTDRFPRTSMLTGLFANALGLHHADWEELDRIQGRIEFAARWDIEPETFVDYQTVDLGQEKMKNPGWTTWGTPEHRDGGPDAAFGIHQRYRHYWANGVMTLSVTLLESDDRPTISDMSSALANPERPIFLGRKNCIPSSPVVVDITTDIDVLSALKKVPRFHRPTKNKIVSSMEACWPAHLGESRRSRKVRVYDLRSWKNQVFTGSRFQQVGLIEEGER